MKELTMKALLMIAMMAQLTFSAAAMAADLSDYSCALTVNGRSVKLARNGDRKQYEGANDRYLAIVDWYGADQRIKATLVMPDGTEILSPEFDMPFKGDFQALMIDVKNGDHANISCSD